MRKHILTFLGLFIFIMIIIPQNVFASTVTQTPLNRYNRVMYNIEDLTDIYTGDIATASKITNSSNTFYNYYTGQGQTRVTIDNKIYATNFINLRNSAGAMPLCSTQCDLNLSFNLGFNIADSVGGSDYSTTIAYLDHVRHSITNLGGVKIFGTDINDQPKEFYCTATYFVGNHNVNNPYDKYFVTCPTSNYKSIDYIQLTIASSGVDTSLNRGINFYTDILTKEISDYTGTQDGIGGGGSGLEDPDPDDPMTDDNIDLNFQNGTLNDINGQLASNNVISDLLLLPVRMYQSILTSLGNNSCVAYNLGSLYGTNLQLPCIQVQNYIGNDLWTIIDLIFCGMFILVIRKKFVDIFNNMTNLKNGGNEIE